MWSRVRPSVQGFANRFVIGLTSAALVAATGSQFAIEPAAPAVTHSVRNVAAIDESPSTIGIADSGIYFTETLEQVRNRLDLVESLGVTDVRLMIPWVFIQRVDPMGGIVDWDLDLDWAKLDQIVQEVDDRGMGILGVLQWSPAWATDGIPGAGHPSNVQDFADFAAAVATRYGNKISAYEVWNEPNAAIFWNPVDPVAYTQMLQATYTSLKAVDPGITVVGAVVGATHNFGGLTMNPVDFVTAMYNAGADGFFDALSFHPYEFVTKFSEQDDVSWHQLTPLFQISQIRELMDQHIDPGEEQLQIWISEYGLPTNVVSAAVQSEFMRDMINAWQSFSGGGPIFLYTTQDDLAGIGDERFFGIFGPNGEVKDAAALKLLRELIRCLDDCSTPVDPVNPVGSLLEFVQQVVAQVLSFVPNLVAAVVTAVTNLIGSLLQGLTSALATPASASAPQTAGLLSLTTAGEDPAAVEGAVAEAEPGAEVPAAPGADPVVPDAAVVDPVVADPVAVDVPLAEPIAEAPVTEPVAEVPVVDPAVEQPSTEPGAGEPVADPAAEPAVDDPAVDEPVVDEPALDDPALAVEEDEAGDAGSLIDDAAEEDAAEDVAAEDEAAEGDVQDGSETDGEGNTSDASEAAPAAVV